MSTPQTKDDWVHAAIEEAHEGIAIVPRMLTIQGMIADVAAGIMVLHDRDGLPITKEMAMERAKNIVFGIANNYTWTGLS